MKGKSAAILAASAVLVLTACSAAPKTQDTAVNETIVWKCGLANPESHSTAVAAQAMADYIYEKTNGRYRIDIHPSSQLGNENDLIESVKLGTLQFSFASTSVMTNYVPELGALDLPFVIESEEHADRAIYDSSSEANQFFTDAVEHAGFKCFAFVEQGFRNVMSSVPVETIDSLHGLKIRTMENPLHLELWAALGASPIPLSSGDTLPALQQGTVDAVEMANARLVTNGFSDVASYYTETRHLYTVGIYTMNPKCYESLSDEDKKIFDEAAQLCIETCNELNRSQDAEYFEQIKNSPNVKGTFEIPVSALEPLVQKVYDAHPEYNDSIALIKKYSE